MKKEYGFDEFDKMSKAQWKEKLNQYLGADLARHVYDWTYERGLSLSAYYNEEDARQKFGFPQRKK